jgi:hypothetical protein
MRTRECQHQFTVRLHRTWWMRLIPFLRHFGCARCSATMVALRIPLWKGKMPDKSRCELGAVTHQGGHAAFIASAQRMDDLRELRNRRSQSVAARQATH